MWFLLKAHSCPYSSYCTTLPSHFLSASFPFLSFPLYFLLISSEMPKTTVDGVFSPAKVDLTVDLGDPFFNRVANGFLKIGTVGLAKVAVEETYNVVNRGSVSKHNFEHSLKAMCKEGAYWGSIAGVYVGMQYGVERVRGEKDWINAMIGGACTGAIVSAACSNKRDKIVMDAITGGALATAAEILSFLT